MNKHETIKISNKKWIQLGAIVLLVLLIILGRFTGTEQRFEPVLPWDGEITRLEITLPGGGPESTITAGKANGKWSLGDRQYPADEGKLTRMADALNNISLEELVSSKGDLERYELTDSSAITVEAFGSDGVLRSVQIGKSADRGRGSYVTIAGRSGIFLVSQDLRGIFDTDLASLRNRQIISMEKGELLSIEVTGPSGSYRMIQEGEGSWAIPGMGASGNAGSSGAENQAPESPAAAGGIDQEKATRFIDQLVSVTASAFADQGILDGADAAGGPTWRFILEGQQESAELAIYGLDPENENAWICSSSESIDPFTVSAWKAEQIMREKGWFLGASE
jgi:hypothetical protein